MNNHAVVTELNGRLMAISRTDFIAPSASREGNTYVVGEVGFRVKRLHTLWKMLLEENRKLASKDGVKAADLEMRREFCDFVYRALRLQVWRDFPEDLAGKAFELYDDWHAGPKGGSARPRETASTRSDDVRLGDLIHASA